MMDKKQAIDLTTEETKQKSEFLKQVIDFANYQKEEIMNTKKGFIILATDGDVTDDGSYTTAIVGGNKRGIIDLIKANIDDDSGVSEILRRAMTETALEHVMDDLIGNMRANE